MAHCLYCNAFFVPRLKGSPQKFCSAKCRVYWHRMQDNPADNQYHEVVFKSNVTDFEKKAAVYICANCGKRMHRKKKYCSAACKQAVYRSRKEKEFLPE